MANVRMFLRERGIEPHFTAASKPIFDSLSLIRSLPEFSMDLYTNPGIIMDIMKKYQPKDTKNTIHMAKQIHAERVGLFVPRSCAPFISPLMFGEFVWLTLRQIILEYHRFGLKTVLHCDANWLPMLKYFTELPKASVLFDFEGVTDMFMANDIIGGWHSMDGDVPATLLAFGTPDEVSEYCEKIITGLCMKGGVMIGSGCDVPLNAKVENVKAMMDSVKH